MREGWVQGLGFRAQSVQKFAAKRSEAGRYNSSKSDRHKRRHRHAHTEIDSQTDRQTGRQADTQTDRQADGQTVRRADRDRHTNSARKVVRLGPGKFIVPFKGNGRQAWEVWNRMSCQDGYDLRLHVPEHHLFCRILPSRNPKYLRLESIGPGGVRMG